MGNKTDLMLKSLVGSDGLETLKKHVYRKDTGSALGPLDIYLPLLVVPRTILAWLIQTLKPMKVGDIKEVYFPGDDTIMINFQKQGRDAYRAEFIQGGRTIHQFEKMNLPAIGGHLMSVGELYDTFIETPKAIMDLGGVTEELASEKPENIKIATVDNGVINSDNTTTIKNMSETVGKLIDALVGNNIIKEAVRSAVKSTVKSTVKPKIATQKETLGKEAIPESRSSIQEAYTSNKRKNLIKDKHIEKNADIKGAEQPQGGALPKGPASVKGPISRGSQPQSQSEQQSQGRQVLTTQFRQENRKPQLPSQQRKGEKMEIEPSSSQSYFRNKLQKRKITKKEQHYYVTPSELYNSCIHCGTTEFAKTEHGPEYSPCACFMVTLLPDAQTDKPFVEVIQKSESNYSLQFNPKADSDTVEAFLSTLKQKNKDENY